jgi:hypothetical protein
MMQKEINLEHILSLQIREIGKTFFGGKYCNFSITLHYLMTNKLVTNTGIMKSTM